MTTDNWTDSEKQSYEEARQAILNCSETETTLELILPDLRMLPPEIGQLQNLRKFSLKSHKITALPPEIAQLQNLEEFVLETARPKICSSINPYTGEEKWIEDNSQLENGTAFEELPPEIGQLQTLRKLILSENFISALPSEIGQLQNLEILILRDNELRALPSEFGQLHTLQELDLSGNKLTALPPEFGNLKNLQKLNLSRLGKLKEDYRNQISALPPEFGQLHNLQELNLWNNKLTALPPEFGNLQNLRKLDLRHNKLTALPPEFGNLQNLESLDLCGNSIQDLSALANHSNQALKVFVVGRYESDKIPPYYWVHPSQWQLEYLQAEPSSTIRSWAQAIYRKTLDSLNPENPEESNRNNMRWNVINQPAATPGSIGHCTLNTLLYFGTDKLLRLEFKQVYEELRGVFFYDEQRLTLNEDEWASYTGHSGYSRSKDIDKRDLSSLPCSLLVKGIVEQEPWIYQFHPNGTEWFLRVYIGTQFAEQQKYAKYSFNIETLECTYSYYSYFDNCP